MILAEKRRKSLNDFNQLMDFRRKTVKKTREERKKNIKDFEEIILKRNKSIVQEKKEKARLWDNETRLNKSIDLREKVKRYKTIKQGYVKSLRERCLSQRSHTEKLREEYNISIQQEKQIEFEAQNEILQLEKIETSLIQELSTTVDIKKGLLEDLIRLKQEY